MLCPCFIVLRVANRLSGLFFFSAFSIVAIFWAEVLNHARKTAANRALMLKHVGRRRREITLKTCVRILLRSV